MRWFDKLAAYASIGILANPVSEKYLSYGPATKTMAGIALMLLGVSCVNGLDALIKAVRDSK